MNKMGDGERGHREWVESELRDGNKYILKLPKNIDESEISDILGSFDIAHEITLVEE